MELKQRHSWELLPREAIQWQKRLVKELHIEGAPERIEYLLALDVSYLRWNNTGYAAGILFKVFPQHNVFRCQEVQRFLHQAMVNFPYVPGLLSFREIPLLIPILEKISLKPDLIMVDGMGIAHPRRMGLASHLGLITDIPTIGVGKSRLIGEHGELPEEKGASIPLWDKGELVGYLLRSRKRVKPLYISPGNLIGIKEAVEITFKFVTRFRLPEPMRMVDNLTRSFRKECLKKEE